MNTEIETDKADILTRLKKIEGQVKGIQKMVEEEKCCNEVMVQISAIRSAINRVGGMMMDRYIKECIKENSNEMQSNKHIDEMIETIVKYVK